MRFLTVLALAISIPAGAFAADAVPDLKGVWKGTFRSLVYGTNDFHPGTQTPADPPRIREVVTTVDVEGQDGNLAWGKAWVGDGPKDPFAWAIEADNKTIVGSDLDGSHFMTVVGPDRIERCYIHSGVSPSKSIVATCGIIERAKQ